MKTTIPKPPKENPIASPNPKNEKASSTPSDFEAPQVIGNTVEELKEEHADAVEEKRVKRQYTKRKTKAPDAEVDTMRRDEFVSGLALFVKMGAEMLFKRLPNPIPPTPEELAYLNTSVTAIASKHFATIANWDAELSLVLCIVVVLAPRLVPKDKPAEAIEA